MAQVGGRLGLPSDCAEGLQRTASDRVDLQLFTTITGDVRKQYDWKSAALVPRVEQVLGAASERPRGSTAAERHKGHIRACAVPVALADVIIR